MMTVKLAPVVLLLAVACSSDPASAGGAIGNVKTEPELVAPEKTIASPPKVPTAGKPGGVAHIPPEEEPEPIPITKPRDEAGGSSKFQPGGTKTPPPVPTNGGVREGPLDPNDDEPLPMTKPAAQTGDIEGPTAPAVAPVSPTKTAPTVPELGPGARPPGT